MIRLPVARSSLSLKQNSFLQFKQIYPLYKRRLMQIQAQNTNRLEQETSPYLLQHKNNPVDWYPWGDEAFQLAESQKKLIFLSIGYSTCHWCHVMERESFESEEVASIMNENFVCIKVDREERPDVDSLYMTYVQATTGHGGWPMSVFLTPDLTPVFGGTYFPPENKYGQPGFKRILQSLATAWGDQQENMLLQAENIRQELKQITSAAVKTSGGLSDTATHVALQGCVQVIVDQYDKQNGGFTTPPKFPMPSMLRFLLRYKNVLDTEKAEDPESDSEMQAELHKNLLHTLRSICYGGMWDHVGGGWHRYSVDELWHVPHFEKMMYDNTQLVTTLCESVQIYGNVEFIDVIRGALDWTIREMAGRHGGILAAQDADSVDEKSGEKKEGAYYVWDYDVLVNALGGERGSAFSALYNAKKEGNCQRSQRSDPLKEFIGTNVLYVKLDSPDDTIDSDRLYTSIPHSQDSFSLSKCRQALYQSRLQRPNPGTDDKVVSSWNGMAMSAFCKAGQVIKAQLKANNTTLKDNFPATTVDPTLYVDTAEQIAQFVEEKLLDVKTGDVLRCWCKGVAKVQGVANDYAHLASGFLDLYECTGKIKYLQRSISVQNAMNNGFWDNDKGGYFSSTSREASLFLRLKDSYDGAEPSAISVATDTQIRLAAMIPTDDNQEFQNKVTESIKLSADSLLKGSSSQTQMYCAILRELEPVTQCIICGDLSSENTQNFITTVHQHFILNCILVIVDTSDKENMEFWRKHNPAAMSVVDAYQSKQKDSQPACVAFVCRNYTCQEPAESVDKLRLQLQKLNGQQQEIKPVEDQLAQKLGGQSIV